MIELFGLGDAIERAGQTASLDPADVQRLIAALRAELGNSPIRTVVTFFAPGTVLPKQETSPMVD